MYVLGPAGGGSYILLPLLRGLGAGYSCSLCPHSRGRSSAMRDVVGVVATDATFYNYPLDLTKSIMIIARTFAHVLQASTPI